MARDPYVLNVEPLSLSNDYDMQIQMPMFEPHVKITSRGVVELIGSDGSIVAQTTLDELSTIMTAYTNAKGMFPQLLPRGCRFVRQSKAGVTLVVELEPGIRTIKTVSRHYEVAMPWQYFLIQFKKIERDRGYNLVSTSLFWSQHRVMRTDTPIMVARIPNVNPKSGLICLGSAGPESNLPLADRVDTLVRDFYSPGSVFNADLGWNLPNGYRGLGYWQAASVRDPYCWLKWKDWQAGMPERYRTTLLGVLPPFMPIGEIDFAYVTRRIREVGGPKW